MTSHHWRNPTLALLVVASCAGAPMLLTEAHSGHRVTVRVRQEFVVRLLSNPSTGYSWTADAYTGINFARNRAGIGNLLTGLTKEASAIPYSHRAVWNWRWKDRTG